MPKPCERQQPTARLKLHSPNVGWRGHIDKTVQVKAETDFDLVAGVFVQMMENLRYTDTPFVTSFILDMVNQLPEDTRRNIALGIIQGFGTIAVEPAEGGVNVITGQRYPALKEQPGDEAPPGFKTTDAGVVVPEQGQGPSGLLIPS